MRVYAVMVLERHVGPVVELFHDPGTAALRAREVAEDYARSAEDIEEPEGFYGCTYYAEWGTEGDHVFVVEKEVL